DEHRLSGPRDGCRRVPARGRGPGNRRGRARGSSGDPESGARRLRAARCRRISCVRSRDRFNRARPPGTVQPMSMSTPDPQSEEQRDELVEQVAREIQLRGLTTSAVHFLQASRPYRPLGANAMLFFDPVLHGLFGGEIGSASEILADDDGIEQLIARLEEFDEETAWDA